MHYHRVFAALLDRTLALDWARARARALARAQVLDPTCARALAVDLAWALARPRALDRDLGRLVLSESDALEEILKCTIFGLDLRPHPQWREALLEIYVPTIPKWILLMQPEWWTTVRDVFQHGEPTHSDVYAASALLMFSGMLYIIGLDQPDSTLLREGFSYTDEQIEELQQDSESARAIFDQIAELTRSRDDAPLRIAHCIRDLAYGDESRSDDLKRMVQSEDPEYREIFERCYWRATVEEEKGL